MKAKEFVIKLASCYKESMVVNDEPNIRLTTLEAWITKNGYSDSQIQDMFDKVILGFIPTSTNTYPLIPHIIEICEIETTDKSKAELAQSVADKMIWAFINIDSGKNVAGARDTAYKHIGSLGTTVLQNLYGSWYNFHVVAENESSLEFMRKNLKTSILAHINRVQKGIDNQTPELNDLNNNSQIAIGA